MKINMNNKKRKYVKGIQLLQNENFYAIPDASNYAFSNYFRLYQCCVDDSGKLHSKEIKHYPHVTEKSIINECYDVTFDNGERKTLSIKSLIRLVFLPRNFDCYIEPIDFSKKVSLENILILNKSELTEFLITKMEKKPFDIEKNRLILLNEFKGKYNEFLQSSYRGMMTRSTNENYKKIYPDYKFTTIYSEWKNNSDKVKSYLLDCIYFYPNKLVIDKDLMGFGLINTYAPGLAIPLPEYLNKVFKVGKSEYGYSIKKKQLKDGTTVYFVPKGVGKISSKTFKIYSDALNYARHSKSRYINSLADKEEMDGYLPEYIIHQMRRWAILCEDGKIKIWEPSNEIKERLLIDA